MVKSVVEDAIGTKINVIPVGGTVLLVISGEVDAYVHVTRIKKWDICAGSALLGAVEGRLTTLKGHIIDYGSGEVKDKGLLATLNNHDNYVTVFQETSEWGNFVEISVVDVNKFTNVLSCVLFHLSKFYCSWTVSNDYVLFI